MLSNQWAPTEGGGPSGDVEAHRGATGRECEAEEVCAGTQPNLRESDLAGFFPSLVGGILPDPVSGGFQRPARGLTVSKSAFSW